MRRGLLIIGLLLVQAHAVVAQVNGAPQDYRVGPRDLLEVRVEEDPSLDTTERVGADGRFSMPLVGSVYVQRLTPQEIEGKIATLLAEKYITDPTVSVIVREFESEVISVFGEVRRPGRIPATGPMTLLQAITAAGGLSPNHGQNIHILRIASNGLTDQLEVTVSDLMERGDPDVNVPVGANDVINIPPDPDISIFLVGEVMKQGEVRFKASSKATLLQALASAGGLTDRASRRAIIVLRKAENGRDERLRFNLNEIIDGDQPDPLLAANDRIVVEESFW